MSFTVINKEVILHKKWLKVKVNIFGFGEGKWEQSIQGLLVQVYTSDITASLVLSMQMFASIH